MRPSLLLPSRLRRPASPRRWRRSPLLAAGVLTAAMMGPAALCHAADLPIVSAVGLPDVDGATGHPLVSTNGTACCCGGTGCSYCTGKVVGSVPATVSLIVSGVTSCPDDCSTCGSFHFVDPAPNGAICLNRLSGTCSWSGRIPILVQQFFSSSGCTGSHHDYVTSEWELTVSGNPCGGTGYLWGLSASVLDADGHPFTEDPSPNGHGNFFNASVCETSACSTLSFANTVVSGICVEPFGPCTIGFFFGGSATATLGGC